MSLLKTICQQAADKNLPILLIGGHAVIAHGYQRNTFDEHQSCIKNSNESRMLDTLDLEFPDWSELTESGTRIPMESAFALCEEYAGYFPKVLEERRKQRKPKDIVPFEL